MSEYQRFVSYIYLYDKGIKVKNSGFAKIECKDNILRIKMSLKGVFNNVYEKWNVYLLVEERKEILGINIGELKGKGTSAEFQLVCSSENLNQTSKNFQDVKGLAVISSGNKKYATFWKDTELTIEDFKEYTFKKEEKANNILNFRKEKKEEQKYVEAMSVEENKKEEVKAQEETEQEKNLEKVLSTEVVDSNDPIEITIQKGEENVINNQYQNSFNADIEAKEAQKIPQPMPEVEPEIEEEGTLQENWDKLIKEYKNLTPFADNKIECIRIELKDLRMLPKSQWGISSNSFVLHGFYNYQYLILGKTGDRFILGVPGIFSNREKLLAGLFGFNEFKPAQVSEYKTGRFGYWYKYL